ncbi:hypothetical protein [Sporosarcina sp. HYO08]|uniref:hypothetical protein n=1 Tax=Sporosarcina sp. HYO08 TaxID=1759557 RepID=UPI0012E3ECEA|nr:hypothetical protein [Sporosarcina sp. HYO08]
MLCIGLVFAEIAEVKSRGDMPEKVNGNLLSIYFDQIIQKNGPVDSSFILDERQHTAGESLTIHHPHENATIYVERTKDQGIIKEIIYKPLLDINQYDFSESVKVAKPIWRNNELTIPEQPKNFIRYISYHDSAVMNQLTTARGAGYNGFSSGYQTMVVHLTVPENVDIHLDSTDYVTFIDK